MNEIYIVLSKTSNLYGDEFVNVFDSVSGTISYASNIASSTDDNKIKKIIQLNTSSLRGAEMELTFTKGKFELIKVPVKRKNP